MFGGGGGRGGGHFFLRISYTTNTINILLRHESRNEIVMWQDYINAYKA